MHRKSSVFQGKLTWSRLKRHWCKVRKPTELFVKMLSFLHVLQLQETGILIQNDLSTEEIYWLSKLKVPRGEFSFRHSWIQNSNGAAGKQFFPFLSSVSYQVDFHLRLHMVKRRLPAFQNPILSSRSSWQEWKVLFWKPQKAFHWIAWVLIRSYSHPWTQPSVQERNLMFWLPEA